VTIDLREVLVAYPPALAQARWTQLGNAGGFSGALVWRGLTADGRELCLKAHPSGADAARLERVMHHWMFTARSAGLSFVPRIEATRDGRTVVVARGRAWEVAEWMPGRPDFHVSSTDSRLFAAIDAVARLHETWSKRSGGVAPCSAIHRRWKALRAWETIIATGWRPSPTPDDPVRTHVEPALDRLSFAVGPAVSALVPWLTKPVPVQPCLCDVWHDHILFTGDRVTGLIDYAAAKMDHVTGDLARLLGSLVPGHRERIAAALDAYRTIRPLSHPELVELLDWTGVIVAVTNWLLWLYRDGRVYSNRSAVAERFGTLVRRLSDPDAFNRPRGG
jgi:Ser/Thr protein kinase RdoA (MazF antagonist)